MIKLPGSKGLIGVDIDGNVLISGKDWRWLIGRAERVQELETYVDTSTYIQRKLRKQNKRYREALEHMRENSDDKITVFISRKALEDSN